MTYRINAHFESGSIVLDEPLPTDLGPARIVVEISEAVGTTPEELAQSESGFARMVLMDSAEDIWEND